MTKQAEKLGLGALLRQAREKLAMSQRAVAIEAGISATLMNELERETRFPSLVSLRKKYVPKLTKVLKVTRSELEQAWQMTSKAGRKHYRTPSNTQLGGQLVAEMEDVEIPAALLEQIAKEARAYARPLTVIDLLRLVQLHTPQA